MRALLRRFRLFFAYAALFSCVINLLLLVPPLYMLQLFDRVISSRSTETLVMLSVGAVAALVMMALLDAVRARLLLGCGVALDRKLGPRMMQEVAGAVERGAAERSRAMRDVHTVRQLFTGPGVLALFDAPWLPVFLVLIFLFHPLLGAVALAGSLVMAALAVLNELATRGALERAQAAAYRAGHFADVAARNAETLRALGMRPAVTRRWAALNEATLAGHIEAGARGSAFATLTRFFRQAIQMAMLGAGAWLVIEQRATPGVMLAATIILGRALAPLELLVAGWRQLVEARDAWRRLDRDLKARGVEAPHTELPAPSGEISVEKVSLVLPGAERPVLRGISFALRPGESLGIIGPSAAGKSTLARLLVGAWAASTGTVRLDGADIRTWPSERLAPHLGYLPQQVELFPGTVAENIARLAEPDAAAVLRAAQRAHVHPFLLRLPQGYDTPVGESGERLSPGQRQMVALARALYGNPRLVVLDEPNADLDVDGENALLAALAQLKQERVTLVVVAHRPALLGGVDKLLVLKEGAVEIFGPRAEILARVARVIAPAARGVA